MAGCCEGANVDPVRTSDVLKASSRQTSNGIWYVIDRSQLGTGVSFVGAVPPTPLGRDVYGFRDRPFTVHRPSSTSAQLAKRHRAEGYRSVATQLRRPATRTNGVARISEMDRSVPHSPTADDTRRIASPLLLRLPPPRVVVCRRRFKPGLSLSTPVERRHRTANPYAFDVRQDVVLTSGGDGRCLYQ